MTGGIGREGDQIGRRVFTLEGLLWVIVIIVVSVLIEIKKVKPAHKKFKPSCTSYTLYLPFIHELVHVVKNGIFP